MRGSGMRNGQAAVMIEDVGPSPTPPRLLSERPGTPAAPSASEAAERTDEALRALMVRYQQGDLAAFLPAEDEHEHP